MQKLKTNYSKNLAIMAENLKRGLSSEQAKSIVDNFESQFINNNLLGKDEKNFINDLRALIVSHFTMIEVNIVK